MNENEKAPVMGAVEVEEQNKDRHNEELLQRIFLENATTKIVADALEPLQLPIDGLNESFQVIAEKYAEGLQANRDFVFSAMMIAVSTAVGKRLRVYDGRFYNYLTTWCCLVADSGSNKTAPVRAILDPITKQNALNYEAFKAEMTEYKLREKGGDTEAEIPIFKQLILGDCTPEARLKVLSEVGSVLLYSDELSTFLQNLNRYTKSGETSQLLSMWSGEDVSVNRKSELPLFLESPQLNLLGGIQPDIVAENLGTNFLKSSGFNYRWLFAFPDKTPPVMYAETSVPEDVRNAWFEFIEDLIKYDFSSMPTLFLTNEAKGVYIDYFNELQNQINEVPSYMAGVLKKLQISVERWSALVHLMGNCPDISRIQADEMEFSVRCMRYFEKCAWKIFDTISAPSTDRQRLQFVPTKKEVLAALQVVYPTLNKSACAKALGIAHTNFNKVEIKEQVAEYRKMLESSDIQNNMNNFTN